jgi:hypothetical protein
MTSQEDENILQRVQTLCSDLRLNIFMFSDAWNERKCRYLRSRIDKLETRPLVLETRYVPGPSFLPCSSHHDIDFMHCCSCGYVLKTNWAFRRRGYETNMRTRVYKKMVILRFYYHGGTATRLVCGSTECEFTAKRGVRRFVFYENVFL